VSAADALRRIMSAVALFRAAPIEWGATIAYVDREGSELERARLRGILGRARPDDKVTRALEARQNEDGGFPYQFVQGRPSTIEATATALMWLDDLGLFAGPHVDRALVFLLAQQRPDGSWDEPPGLLRYGPPPRLLPSDPRVRVASTALVAYWLARAGAGTDAVQRAAAYLRACQTSGGRFVGFLRTTWFATACLHLMDGPGSDAVARGLEALAAVDDSRWRAGALAELLRCLGTAAVDEEARPIGRCLDLLARWRRPDGSWTSEDGPAYAVEVALQALRALLCYATSGGGEPAGDAAPKSNTLHEDRR
jgi:hypothetical protein